MKTAADNKNCSVKLTALILICASVILAALALTACSRFKKPAGPGGEENTYPLTEAETTILSVAAGNFDLDSLSLEELNELYDKFLESGETYSINMGAEYDLLYKDVEINGFDPEAEADFTYSQDAQTAVFSDEKWIEKEYEALDITENMSPEEKAQYEAAIAELENFDADAFQREIDEMLKGMDEFSDYDPSEHQHGPDEPGIVKEWPDNDITRGLPKPDFKDPMIVSDTSSVTLVSTSSDVAAVKAYAAKLKAAGFTIDVNEQDNEFAGVAIYSFTAYNADGRSVSLSFAAGNASLSITKG